MDGRWDCSWCPRFTPTRTFSFAMVAVSNLSRLWVSYEKAMETVHSRDRRSKSFDIFTYVKQNNQKFPKVPISPPISSDLLRSPPISSDLLQSPPKFVDFRRFSSMFLNLLQSPPISCGRKKSAERLGNQFGIMKVYRQLVEYFDWYAKSGNACLCID